MTVACKPRVLVVTRNLPPLVGGMERLLANTLVSLAEEWRVGVVGPSGSASYLNSAEFAREVPTRPIWRFLPACMAMSVVGALAFRPDVVLSGSGLTVPAAAVAAKVAGVPLVTWLHGLDIVADSWLYQSFFVRRFRHCRAVIVNSHHTGQLAAGAGVPSQCIHVVHPGVTVREPVASVGSDFRERHQLSRRPVILSVGRLTRRKGLVPFIRQCLPGLVQSIPDLVLAVIGDDATEAVHDSREAGRDAILKVSQEVGVSTHVRMLGSVSESELVAAYQAANVLVFPVLEQRGDVEGFGMVAAEAAANGLPTVAFRVGGIPDAVRDGQSGWLLEPGDYVGMGDVIERWIRCSDGAGVSVEACLAHAAALSWSRFGVALRDVLRRVRGVDDQTAPD